MDAVKNDVKRLVKIELAAANKKFRMFAGPHEGAGIIQEEVVEAAKEMNGLRRELNAMWIGVYSNNPQISTKGVYDRAVALAVEAIQTAAMARKFERSQRRHWPGAKEPHYGEGECNKQVIDLTYEYSQAQIKMPDGTVIEGKVDSWNDYEGDQLQVKINGTTYLAHSSNVVLWH